MKVVFVRDHTDDDGNVSAPGEVKDVPVEVGKRLIREGVAEARVEVRGPTETKDDSGYEQPDEEDEDDNP